MGTPRVSRAINVLIYDLGSARFMIAIREKWWQGRDTLDRRLARAFPLRENLPCPPGVQPELWFALQALSQVVNDQVNEHLRAQGR